MSLSLPYPNIVFVPLDKLTAGEMNQLVANDQALANAMPSSSTSTRVVEIGNIKIAWGTATIANIPSGQEKSQTIKFNTSFNQTPVVTITVNSWVGAPRAIAGNITSQQFDMILGHSQGTTQSVSANWIAIG